MSADTDWAKTKPIISRGDKWDGEDEEENIKDNWDEEEEEQVEKVVVEAPKKQPIATKKKKPTINYKSTNDTETDEIRASNLSAEEILKLQEESDLLLAKEAFGDSSDPKNNTSIDITLSSKEDFELFKRNLIEKLVAVEKSPHYVPFLDTLFRELCASLETDDIKRISSSLSALFNEKVKAQKAGAKQKKKGKGFSLRVERNEVDLDSGNNDLADYDDFM